MTQRVSDEQATEISEMEFSPHVQRPHGGDLALDLLDARAEVRRQIEARQIAEVNLSALVCGGGTWAVLP